MTEEREQVAERRIAERRRHAQARAAQERQFNALKDEVKELITSAFADLRAELGTRLDSQDVAIAANTQVCTNVARDTSSIVSFWDAGISGAKFFCRAAAAWVFVYKRVIPPVTALFLIFYMPTFYLLHHAFPDWFAALLKLL